MATASNANMATVSNPNTPAATVVAIASMSEKNVDMKNGGTRESRTPLHNCPFHRHQLKGPVHYGESKVSGVWLVLEHGLLGLHHFANLGVVAVVAATQVTCGGADSRAVFANRRYLRG
jgi:hypothetical protein